jgi:uncharacterized membrane protein YdfJ with MMPL/SSD domain
MQTKRNLAARAGRWSAQHRKKAILGWLAFVAIAFVVGGMMGTKEVDPGDTMPGASGRAAEIMDGAFREASGEQVLVEHAKLNANDPKFHRAVDDVVARLKQTKGVDQIVSPYSREADQQLARSGHAALVTFELPGDDDTAMDRVDTSLATTKAAAAANPGFRIAQFGDASLNKGLADDEAKAMQKAEMTSLPLTLLILVLAFGAFMAAGIPVLLAITGVMATMGLLGPVSHVLPVSGGASSMVLLIGLAVGVDYALFYLRREREERAAGRSAEAALEAAASTSGRAVLISGVTVMIAMAGLYLSGVPMIAGFATGTILVVAVSVLASVTVLPAVLSKLGDRVEKGRIPFHGRLRRRTAKLALWSRVVDAVMKRPLVAAVSSTALLVALALPALGMQTSLAGTESFSRDLAVVQTFDRIQAEFPSESMPAIVAVKADDVGSAPVQAAIADLGKQAVAQPELFAGMPSVEISDDRTVATIALPLHGQGNEDAANEALDVLRDDLVPATLGGVDGVQAEVTGETAGIRDFNDALISHVPLVFGFVMLAAFLLLLVTFRSLVVPIKALLLNLLSVGAAYGLLVLVFQHGWGESLLGFESNGSVEAWIPAFLFVILFGLSMDYHVFILSRVREAFDGGMSTGDAVAHGVKSTAGTVSSAAIVMVAVFSIFATMSDISMKQLGVGLAAAVFLDATLIRGVLLPASMKLLGDRNWWLPKKLGWLPEIQLEGEPAPAKA